MNDETCLSPSISKVLVETYRTPRKATVAEERYKQLSTREREVFQLIAEGHATICFLYQQSAEKYHKAYIIAQGLKFLKTHDLAALLKTCLEKTPAIASLADDCDLLATFYVETRYPDHWPATFGQEDAELAHQASNRVRSRIRRELGLE